MKRTDITADKLKSVLRYDSDLDRWTRIYSPLRPDLIGATAGNADNGYWVIKIGSTKYKAHHLVWLLETGSLPTYHIDHIDGDRGNNRFSNLREAGRNINAQNQKRPHKNNSTGFLGVHKSRGKYLARLSIGDRRIFLGRFKTPEEAYAAYITAKRLMHPGCTI